MRLLALRLGRGFVSTATRRERDHCNALASSIYANFIREGDKAVEDEEAPQARRSAHYH
jgi:hypothetical protein